MAGALGVPQGHHATHRRDSRLPRGLQRSEARDQALAHSEDGDLPNARHLWSYLARRCVPLHTDLAPPLLTLLAWVASRQDDTLTARNALKEALSLDPTYRMANLLHDAINRGVDREEVLEVFRIALQESLDVILTTPRCDRLRRRRAHPLSASASHVLRSYS